MIFIKRLKIIEKKKVGQIYEIPEIKRISLPTKIIGDYMIMPWARKIMYNQRPEISEIVELLKQLYVFNQSNYSEGIYSFARMGKNKNTNELFYEYIEKEIADLVSKTQIKRELKDIYKICMTQWGNAIQKYRDTYFFRYYILHGDIHIGNIVRYKGKLKLIDWEYFRSGPKEIEISFYLCWDHLRKKEKKSDIKCVLGELDYCLESRLIDINEYKRIKELLIPMWIILSICYLSNGNLLYEKDRIEACNFWGRKYMEMLENDKQ